MKVVFLFSGSGLRFPFHAGVYQRFLNVYGSKLDARFIGVSGGAVVAAAAAQGYSGEEILEMTQENISGSYDNILQKKAIVSGTNINVGEVIGLLNLKISDLAYLLLPNGKARLKRKLGKRLSIQPLFGDLSKLRKIIATKIGEYLSDRSNPFGVVVTNVVTEKPETLVVGSGISIPDMVLASIAVPGIFPVQEIEGLPFQYSDGGIVDRMGISALSQMMDVWGWNDRKDVRLVVCDARAEPPGYVDSYSSVASLLSAYHIATNQRDEIPKRMFSQIYEFKNRTTSSAHNITSAAAERNFTQGLYSKIKF